MYYLDSCATTKLSFKVEQAYKEALSEYWANPNSLHDHGIRSLMKLKECEEFVKSKINGHNGYIIWTSSGTQANQLAIQGICKGTGEMLSSPVSHKSVYDLRLRYGMALLVDEYGRVSQDTKRLVTQFTKLISIPLVNNETGIYDFPSEIKEMFPGVLLHVDAVQALGKIPLDVEQEGADLVTFSAHKIHGPKGIGCLWVRNDTNINIPYLGTPNLPAIIGMTQAMNEIDPYQYEYFARGLEDIFLNALDATNIKYKLNFPYDHRLCGILSISFPNVDAHELLLKASSNGVMISTGSACNKQGKSHVLENLGLSEEVIDSTVRISFAKDTTQEDVESSAEIITNLVQEMQNGS